MEASPTTAGGSRRAPLQAVVATVRPRQWIKNALVIAAAGAAGALGHDDVPVRVGLACLAFCLLASGIYAVNDVHDAAEIGRIRASGCDRSRLGNWILARLPRWRWHACWQDW